MSFDKTKASSSGNSDEDVEKEEDLKDEEDTSTSSGQEDENTEAQEEDTSTNDEESEGDESNDDSADDDSENDGEEDENSVEYWKQKAKKAEEEKDNYKQGMLSAKAKKRTIDAPKVKEDKPNVNEAVVMSVLAKQNEQKVLREVINPKSSLYIPELVDDDKYYEIITYLPRNLDKSSPETIHKALKLATKMWKEDKGIQDKPKDTGKKARADLSSSRSASAGGSTPPKKSSDRKIIKKSASMSEWY